MSTIFDYLKDIITTKTPRIFSIEEEREFIPFLVQRWISMKSPEYAFILNETINRYWSILEQNQEWYDMLIHVIPQSKSSRVSYIKKNKKDNKTKTREETLKKMAKNMEISFKEIETYDKNGWISLPKHI
jgi:hypothetical protein